MHDSTSSPMVQPSWPLLDSILTGNFFDFSHTRLHDSTTIHITTTAPPHLHLHLHRMSLDFPLHHRGLLTILPSSVHPPELISCAPARRKVVPQTHMRNHLLYRTSAHYVQEVAKVVIQSVCGEDGAAVAECGQTTGLAGRYHRCLVVSRRFLERVHTCAAW